MDQLVFWTANGISACSLIYVIFSSRSKANATTVAELKNEISGKASDSWVLEVQNRVDKVEDRTTRIESSLDTLPNIAVTHKLEVMIIELSSEVKVIGERLKPVAETSKRMQEMMLERENER